MKSDITNKALVWRGINDMPVKVAGGTVNLGKDSRKDQTKIKTVKLMGLPLNIRR